jgi:hypothetical protein
MANRAVDLVITYRIVKLLTQPFDKSEAFKMGIIDKNGKVLRKARELNTAKEKDSYTILNRFVFNLKRILQRIGLKSKLSSFGVALALLLKENEHLQPQKTLIESGVIKYLKQIGEYDNLLNEHREIPEIPDEPYMTCFGIDIYDRNGELVAEDEYAKTL